MKKYLLSGFYGIVILLAALVIGFKVFQPIKVLPRIRLAPAFSMIDQNWMPLTSEDLRGQIVLYTFTYTNCPSPCNDIDSTLLQIQSRLDEVSPEKARTTFVIISLDSQRDSPTAMLNYARRLDADTPEWKFLTTPDEILLKTVVGSGFKTNYEKKPDGTIAFDPLFVLVDGWGIVRGEYRPEAGVSTADRILRHLEVLGREVNNASGPTKIAYEAAHLFACYEP
jgi:protein SCO1/2